MRDLDGQQAVRCQQLGHASHEVVEVGHLRQRVVAGDQVSRPPGPLSSRASSLAEEPGERGDARGLCDQRDVLGRFDAEDGHPGGDEVPQQVSVIAAQLDDEVVGPRSSCTSHPVGISRACSSQLSEYDEK